jgi:CHAT domain-containing protein
MMKIYYSLCLFVGLMLSSLAFASYQESIDKGEKAFQRGHFEFAMQYWAEALSNLSPEENAKQYIDTSVRLSTAFQSLGRLKRALEVLEPVLPLAKNEPERKASVLMQLSSVYLAMREKNPKRYIDTSIRLSAVYQSLGQVNRALNVLKPVLSLVKDDDPERKASVLLQLSNVYLAMRDFQERDMDCSMKEEIRPNPLTRQEIMNKAWSYIEEAEDTVSYKKTRYPLLWANILNSKGNVFMALEGYADALPAYKESVELANKGGDKFLSVKASINLIEAAVQRAVQSDDGGDYNEVADKVRYELKYKSILRQLKKLPDSLDKAFALINVAQLMLTSLEYKLEYRKDLHYSGANTNRERHLRELYPRAYTYAYDALKEARRVAKKQGNNRAIAYANLYLAQIYIEPERYYKKRIQFAQGNEEEKETEKPIAESADKYLKQYIEKQQEKRNKGAIKLIKDAIHYTQYPFTKEISDADRFMSNRSKVYLPSLKDTFGEKKCTEMCQCKKKYQSKKMCEGSSFSTDDFFKNCKGICQTMAPLFLQNDHPELLFRLERQLGILLGKQGKRQKAVEAYRRAVKHLQFRQEYRTLSQYFRDMEIKIHFELADLLLRQAKAPVGKKKLAILKDAIDSIESFKAAELRNYFQDDCITEAELEKRQKLTSVKVTDDMGNFLSSHSNTAIFYPIIFEDRVELLLAFHDDGRFVIKQIIAPISVKDLNENVHAFRERLEDFEDNPYAPHSKDKNYSLCGGDEKKELFCANELYKGLIKPINAILRKNGIDTLVIISHDILLTTPFAALYNRDSGRYLIEDYALVVTPGWKLTNTEFFQRENFRTLLIGISEKVGGFDALPSVKDELDWIIAALKLKGLKSDRLENSKFTIPNVEEYLRNNFYSIIHFSTHGDFVEEEPNMSYLLAYDKKLRMKRLETLIRTAKSSSKKPLELLNLSACLTAKGNKRAALGLSGMALKTGASSVIGTLWPATERMGVKKGELSTSETAKNEKGFQPISELMKKFYERLIQDKNLSKAKALQQAQIDWFREQRKKGESKLSDSPYFWAPFVLIGNWL